jgi:hypothetical protein
MLVAPVRKALASDDFDLLSRNRGPHRVGGQFRKSVILSLLAVLGTAGDYDETAATRKRFP